MKNVLILLVVLFAASSAFSQSKGRRGDNRFGIGPVIGFATSNPLKNEPENKGWGLGAGGMIQLEHFFRVLAENSVITYQNRLISNLSLPAIERYQNFCNQYPSLIECLPQKQVASYIGVTPEFFSKMLSNLK